MAPGTAAAAALVGIGVVLAWPGRPAVRAERPVDAVVEAERAFSALSARIGHVPAFLAYFADDVVTFGPAPVRGKAHLRAAAAKMSVPPAVRLDWEPWFADVAAAGDLGYTTGPSIFTEAATGKVVRTGWYFSIWKHDDLGWRVAADIGTSSPPAGPLRPRSVESGATFNGASPDGARTALLDAEGRLAASLAAGPASQAYTPFLAASTRLQRDGASPLVGPAAITAFLDGQPKPASIKLVDAVVASSGDFAYTYGECGFPAGAGIAPVGAGFLRAWKRDGGGWRLAADIVTR